MRAEFTIHAAPMGKARPRVTVNGTYTPKRTKDYEQFVRNEYGLQCRGIYFGGVPIQISIMAFFEPPKRASKKARAEMLSGKRSPTKKPDADNIAKAVCDALNGCAWYDDAQIVSMIVVKEYSETERVEVAIQGVES